MKTTYTIFTFVAAIMVFGTLFTGCYTQLDSSKNEDLNQDESYTTKQNDYDDDEYRDGDYYDDEYEDSHYADHFDDFYDDF